MIPRTIIYPWFGRPTVGCITGTEGPDHFRVRLGSISPDVTIRKDDADLLMLGNCDVLGLSYEIWSAAQLAPGDGIEDGCARVAAILREQLFADHEVTK